MRKIPVLLATLALACLGAAAPATTAQADPVTPLADCAFAWDGAASGYFHAYSGYGCNGFLGKASGDDRNWCDSFGPFQGGDTNSTGSILNKGTSGIAVAIYNGTGTDWGGGYSCLRLGELYANDLSDNTFTSGYLIDDAIRFALVSVRIRVLRPLRNLTPDLRSQSVVVAKHLGDRRTGGLKIRVRPVANGRPHSAGTQVRVRVTQVPYERLVALDSRLESAAASGPPATPHAVAVPGLPGIANEFPSQAGAPPSSRGTTLRPGEHHAKREMRRRRTARASVGAVDRRGRRLGARRPSGSGLGNFAWPAGRGTPPAAVRSPRGGTVVRVLDSIRLRVARQPRPPKDMAVIDGATARGGRQAEQSGSSPCGVRSTCGPHLLAVAWSWLAHRVVADPICPIRRELGL
jgi:hypothetical protein